MTIVVLYLDPIIGRMMREVLELEGYKVVATADAGEAVRALEEEAGPALLLADSFHVGPAAREALSQLAAAPTVRSRVRVIGLSAWSGQDAEDGLVDAVIPLPFPVATLLETVEANVRRNSTV